ncbi:hypothetical protein [Streptomyces sp. NPDC001507]|uniref:hypothetical protein n=1 Tax=Streptomyces sp. NPDC001507 TaxID=3364579 RepID=UPI003676D514
MVGSQPISSGEAAVADESGPAAEGSGIVDSVGVLVLAHSEKHDAIAAWKKSFGRHPAPPGNT